MLPASFYSLEVAFTGLRNCSNANEPCYYQISRYLKVGQNARMLDEMLYHLYKELAVHPSYGSS